jgi:hypothetical protein
VKWKSRYFFVRASTGDQLYCRHERAVQQYA